jgi:hypothetical protein
MIINFSLCVIILIELKIHNLLCSAIYENLLHSAVEVHRMHMEIKRSKCYIFYGKLCYSIFNTFFLLFVEIE